MNDQDDAVNEIDRTPRYDIDGNVSFGPDYRDQLSIEQYMELKIRLWNKFVEPETSVILDEISSTPKSSDNLVNPDPPPISPMHYYKKYWGKAVAEWKQRFPTYRHIDGYFYAFEFVRGGPDPYDTFRFDRWAPEGFGQQVQRWIENDLKIVESLESRLRRRTYFLFAFGIAALLMFLLLVRH